MADKPEEPPRGDLTPRDDELTLTPAETLSIAVNLPPARPKEVPEDEAAVAIDEVPVDPGFVQSVTEPTTTSVAIMASRLATGPTPTRDEDENRTDVPPLPGGPSRRDRLRGEHSPQPEPAAMLTADRLLEVNRKTRPGPEGAWQRFVYNVTFRTVNLGDSAKVRARKELDLPFEARIAVTYEAGEKLSQALAEHGPRVAGECLASKFAENTGAPEGARHETQVEGERFVFWIQGT